MIVVFRRKRDGGSSFVSLHCRGVEAGVGKAGSFDAFAVDKRFYTFFWVS